MKKRPKSVYYTSFVCLCFLTAFVYYFLLVREVEESSLPLDGKLTREIEERLNKLEADLKDNRLLLNSVKEQVDLVASNVYLQQGSIDKPADISKCWTSSGSKADGDRGVDMTLDRVYEEVAFDNPDGGVWKQGWTIQINESRLAAEPLRIFVVPHSHNDPGWIKTFAQYYRDQTRLILNNMLKKLSENPTYKFIWAEMSFFSVWFESLSSDVDKRMVKRLLDNGQLEIVTGGWVMNDEANTHYSAMISQMTEGHEWLKYHFGYKPLNGWAIDPFGLSPTMAFLLKRMGLKGMVIQRVHYSVKKYLAQKHLLEFNWKQFWEQGEGEQTDDILCHIEPFYSYDIPHTCGPDPKVCCQFDFKRLPPSRVNCPWKVPPQRITEQNVHQRATLLLEQYRKKAMLYRTNNLLVPLGDDFRYDKLVEWDHQGQNYQRLFDYMNAKTDWNVEIKFGTLSDYFNALSTKSKFPSLVGDFFTYADRDDHYWSGFYTSRPFYKRLDRILESYLRATEILFSFGNMMVSEKNQTPVDQLVDRLTYVRQNLALFQHHDAITGTAKDAVVIDYAERMLTSLHNSQKIMVQMTGALLQIPAEESTDPIKFVEVFPDIDSLSKQTVINLNDANSKWYVIVYNTLGFNREELICVQISPNGTDWQLKDIKGNIIEDIQVNYVWSEEELEQDRLEVCFISHLLALSLTQFVIETNKSPSNVVMSSVKLYNFRDTTSNEMKSEVETPSELELEHDFMKLIFSGADGCLRRVVQQDQGMFIKSHEIRLQFMSYGTKSGKKGTPKSGAYLFIPDTSEAQDLNYGKPLIRVTKGPLVSKIEVLIKKPVPIRHQISIVKGKKYFNIENEFYLNKQTFGNKELLMRLFTDVQNEDLFYTDLNGFQMVRRKRHQKIPLQGNVYPIPSLMYIEDSTTRLNVLSAQPLGGTSGHTGFVDLFLDRRLLQDDQRGVGQGVTDNKQTRELFKVVFEPKPQQELKPSLGVHQELIALLNPTFFMYSAVRSSVDEVSLLEKPLPCDVHLLNLRSAPSLSEFYLFFHRFAVSCDTRCTASSSLTISHLLPKKVVEVLEPTVNQMSLSLMHQIKPNLSLSAGLAVDEMDFAVFALRFR